jgi:hypothetical protein
VTRAWLVAEGLEGIQLWAALCLPGGTIHLGTKDKSRARRGTQAVLDRIVQVSGSDASLVGTAALACSEVRIT